VNLRTEFRDFMGSLIAFPADFFASFWGVAPSESGVQVNELTAAQCAAYWGCVRVLSDAVSMLPLNVVERVSKNEERLASDHPLQYVLNTAPNPETTASDVRSTMMAHCLMSGNAYAELAYNGAGRPAAMYVRSPWSTWPYRQVDVPKVGAPPDIGPGDIFYKTTDTVNHYERYIRAADIVHVKGLGIDSLMGLSPTKYYAREVLGNDLAAQSYSAKFFASDARPGGYLKVPGNRKPEDRAKDAAMWQAAHSAGQAHTVAVLDSNMDWKQTSIPPEEAQFLATREFNRTQIASIFGVPPHFLGEAAESRANMEQRALEFLTFTLKPWLNKIEQAYNIKLFPTVGRNANRFYCRFDTSQFERATYADLLKGVQTGRYAGLLTIDEGRKLLGQQPYSQAQLESKDPGDKLWQPVNMVVIGDDSEPPPAPAPGGAGGNDQDGGDGGGKPPSGTTQGGKRDAELTHYIRMFWPTFRDAFGRIAARPQATERDFERVFMPVLSTIAATFETAPDREPADMLLSEAASTVVSQHIRDLRRRSARWAGGATDPQARAELERAIRAMRQNCQPIEKLAAVEEEEG